MVQSLNDIRKIHIEKSHPVLIQPLSESKAEVKSKALLQLPFRVKSPVMAHSSAVGRHPGAKALALGGKRRGVKVGLQAPGVAGAAEDARTQMPRASWRQWLVECPEV